jgi:hypothetical protein
LLRRQFAALAIEQRGLTDAAASQVTGERIETL